MLVVKLANKCGIHSPDCVHSIVLYISACGIYRSMEVCTYLSIKIISLFGFFC